VSDCDTPKYSMPAKKKGNRPLHASPSRQNKLRNVQVPPKFLPHSNQKRENTSYSPRNDANGS
jgi:hypothetical protein